MSTGKIQLRSIDQFMADYTPVYAPIFPLFLGKSQAYSEEVGQLNFKRLETVGDVRAKHVTPKDTEIRQISVAEKTKIFKKYFLANQYQQSTLQDAGAIEDIVRQVLDEHQKQMDELFLTGDGTASNNVVNNGLFWSGDSNWVEESSATVDGTSGKDPLIDFHKKIMTSLRSMQTVAGRKLILFYGTTLLPYYDSLYAANSTAFKKVLQDAVGGNVSLAEIPSDITPSGANGWIGVNLDQVKMHYTALPSLKGQGVNEEKSYSWHNFLMGSSMLDVTALRGIVKQPATFNIS